MIHSYRAEFHQERRQDRSDRVDRSIIMQRGITADGIRRANSRETKKTKAEE